MQFLAFSRPHKLTDLATALWAAFPEWFYPDPNAPLFKRTDVVIQSDGNGTGQNGWVMFPDTTDAAKVMAVINAYDIAPPPPTPPVPVVSTGDKAPVIPLWHYLIGRTWIWDRAPLS